MSQKEALQLFGDKKIRTAWSEEDEKWYFSIVDVVAVLTNSTDSAAYWRKLKERLKKEGNETVTNCHAFKMTAADGKMRQTDVADQEQLFRLIQSVPSPKAEPFKQWMAQVASERIDEMQDPELAIDRGYEYYRRLGYSEAWINERMKGKDVRKALTDEWKRTGVSGQQYATLTDIITQEWSGMTTRQYKDYKGLKKENLRDHMTRTESALNTLAEVAATELSQKVDPQGFTEQKTVAKRGGKVAATARRELEKQLGQSVITRQNAKSLYGHEAPKEIDEQ
ncbi:MAG: Bro-N domain-containing protein [Bacteroidales bacterium]|nr:Bro-N domain-containing protein [Bacteroidales bacterium]